MVVKETERLCKSYLNIFNSHGEYGSSVLYRMCGELPHIFVNILRHMAYTQIAKADLDMKDVRYVMRYVDYFRFP